VFKTNGGGVTFDNRVFIENFTKTEIGVACSTHGRDEKCIQYFGWKSWRHEITRKT